MPLPPYVHVLSDGGLDSTDPEMPLVYWNTKDNRVVLDGMFTPAELRAIADHLETYSTAGEPPRQPS